MIQGYWFDTVFYWHEGALMYWYWLVRFYSGVRLYSGGCLSLKGVLKFTRAIITFDTNELCLDSRGKNTPRDETFHFSYIMTILVRKKVLQCMSVRELMA